MEGVAMNEALQMHKVENPRPRGSFGFASDAFEVGSKHGFAHADIEIALNRGLLEANGVDMATVRLFRWDDEATMFRLVPESGVDARNGKLSGSIVKSGIYVAIGLPRNPWLGETLETMRRFALLLADPELRPAFLDRICGLILCAPPGFGAFAESGGLGKLGLPDLPQAIGGGLCERCLGIQLNPLGELPEYQLLSPPPSPPKQLPHVACQPILASVNMLATFLATYPQVASAIVWWGGSGPGSGSPVAYPNWTSLQQAELADAFWRIKAGTWTPLSATPSATYDWAAGESAISQADAWQYFVGYVAQSLCVELTPCWPWSILDLSADGLACLLDSRWFFEYELDLGQTAPTYRLRIQNVQSQTDWRFRPGPATPGDPRRVFSFLSTSGLIGASRRETIERLLDWCRWNLKHFAGGWDVANLQDHWQYAGWPPVERVISGTTHPQNGFGHWTAGCHGTVEFLRWVLRTVNIPVFARGSPTHSLPMFVSEGLNLAHGDDPYTRALKKPNPIPIGEYFIDVPTFEAWFDINMDPLQRSYNVGRRASELAVEYVTDWILRLRCADVANNVTDPAQSSVYTSPDLSLFRFYTVAELQATNLWTRLDAEIQARGGCANIPPP